MPGGGRNCSTRAISVTCHPQAVLPAGLLPRAVATIIASAWQAESRLLLLNCGYSGSYNIDETFWGRQRGDEMLTPGIGIPGGGMPGGRKNGGGAPGRGGPP